MAAPRRGSGGRGLFTPIDSMPRWVQILSDATPIKHFVIVARGILMKGAGVADLLRPLAFLAVFAAVMLPLAVLMYRKRTAERAWSAAAR